MVNPTPMCIRASVCMGISLYSVGYVLKENEKQKRHKSRVETCWGTQRELNVLGVGVIHDASYTSIN